MAFTLCIAAPSAAQLGNGGGGGAGGGGGSGGGALTGAGGSDDGAECMPAESTECTERCPTFDTCYNSSTNALYYRVAEQRFDCEGLNCVAASARKDDYCCQRGEFAPDDDDGGCALPGLATGAGSSGGSSAWLGLALGVGVLGLARARRRAAAARAVIGREQRG